MTRNNDSDQTVSAEGWTIPLDPANPALGRRTVLAGAAWSVPVIAAAIATPLAAASAGEPALEFINDAYQVSACGSTTAIGIQLSGVAPVSGQAVIVTLPAGLVWSDGTSGSRTLTTDANGVVAVPSVKATDGNGGTYAISARLASSTVSDVASVTVQPAGDVVYTATAQGWTPSAPVPGNRHITDLARVWVSNGAGGGAFRTIITAGDGTAWYDDGGGWNQMAASSGGWEHVAATSGGTGNGTIAQVMSKGGVVYYASDTTGWTPMPAVPGGRTVTDLAVVYLESAGVFRTSIAANDGTMWTYTAAGGWVQVTGAPAGSEHVATTPSGNASPVIGQVVSKGGIIYRATEAGWTALPAVPGGRKVSDLAIARLGASYRTSVIADDGTFWYYAEGAGWLQAAAGLPLEHVATGLNGSGDNLGQALSGPARCV